MLCLDKISSEDFEYSKIRFGNDELIVLVDPKGYHLLNVSRAFGNEHKMLVCSLYQLYKATHLTHINGLPENISTYFEPTQKVSLLGACYIHKDIQCLICLNKAFNYKTNPIMVCHEKYEGIYLGVKELDDILKMRYLSDKEYLKNILYDFEAPHEFDKETTAKISSNIFHARLQWRPHLKLLLKPCKVKMTCEEEDDDCYCTSRGCLTCLILTIVILGACLMISFILLTLG